MLLLHTVTHTVLCVLLLCAGSTTLCGLVKGQAAHTATAQHRSPRSRAQGKGESLTTAHSFQNLEVSTTGRIEQDRSPHISLQCNGAATASLRLAVTCIGGRVWALRCGACPKAHWRGAEQGFHGGRVSCRCGHEISQTTERSLQARRGSTQWPSVCACSPRAWVMLLCTVGAAVPQLASRRYVAR